VLDAGIHPIEHGVQPIAFPETAAQPMQNERHALIPPVRPGSGRTASAW